jgi:hypothetical protein
MQQFKNFVLYNRRIYKANRLAENYIYGVHSVATLDLWPGKSGMNCGSSTAEERPPFFQSTQLYISRYK